MNNLTTTEHEEIWNISQRRVSLYCKEGSIPGAEFKGNVWLIAENTEKPEDPLKKHKENWHR